MHSFRIFLLHLFSGGAHMLQHANGGQRISLRSGFFPSTMGDMRIELWFPGLEASIFIQPAELSQQPNRYIVHHQISSCSVITVSLVAFLHPSSILGTVTSFLSQEITLHFLSFMEINSNSKCFPSF